MIRPWFRMYSEWLSDPVVQSLAFEDQRHHVAILCLKNMGVLDRDIAKDQRERIIQRGLGLDPVTTAEVKRRLQEVGLIDKNWQPKGWENRQFVSDSSTERVRKYRERKESGNVSSTLPERYGNAPDTDTDTDTEKRERPRKRGTTLPDGFTVSSELIAWAKAKGLTERQISEETEKFCDHHRSKGSVFRDWDAAWRTWIRKHLEWRKERHGIVDIYTPA